MSKKIYTNLNQEQVEEILQDYGYSLRQFGESIMQVATFVNDNFKKKGFAMIEERVKSLEKLRAGLTMQIDDFLGETNLYETGRKYFGSKIPPWTAQNRVEFIEKQYGLKEFVKIIGKQIEQYSSLKAIFNPRFKEENFQLLSHPLLPVKIMPITFLALVWRMSLKSGRQIDWKNMERLMKWFAKQLKKYGENNIFRTENGEIPSSDSLREYSNRYKGTNYEYIALIIYVTIFGKKVGTQKDAQKAILEEMIDYFEENQFYVNEWLEKIDFMVINSDLLLKYSQKIFAPSPSD